MTFLTIYLALISVSGILSVVLLALAGVDHGTSSFFLMLLAPSLTIVHHIVIVFIPTYTEHHFRDSKTVCTLPTHATVTYITLLITLSAMWTLSTLLTFYAVGMNVASRSPNANQRTGAAECVLGVFESGVVWAMSALCIKERTVQAYKDVPLSAGA